MRKGLTKVVAAQKQRVGRCHGQSAGRGWRKPQRPSWRLWLACGHKTSRTALKVPRSVKCSECVAEKEFGWKHTTTWNREDIPNEFGVIRFK